VNPRAVVDVCYAQHYGRSLRFALSMMADRQLAEDLVQEAAYRIARLPADKEIGNPWGYWCKTIARCAAQQHRAQYARRKGFTETPLEILWHAGGDVTEADVIAARDELAGVMQAMEKLTPPELRELTAHLVECTETTGKRRHNTDASNHRVTLGRARQHLAELMAP